MNELYQPAFVRVSGPPNSNFLVGYPGISATLVRDPASSAPPCLVCVARSVARHDVAIDRRLERELCERAFAANTKFNP